MYGSSGFVEQPLHRLILIMRQTQGATNRKNKVEKTRSPLLNIQLKFLICM